MNIFVASSISCAWLLSAFTTAPALPQVTKTVNSPQKTLGDIVKALDAIVELSKGTTSLSSLIERQSHKLSQGFVNHEQYYLSYNTLGGNHGVSPISCHHQ